MTEDGRAQVMQWGSEGMLAALARYTAQGSAGHLLRRLRPGQRVLDFGCGPGTISVGLAKAAHPGELHGLDVDEQTIEMARSVAESQGVTNATFQVGDARAMPFDDGYFDVAHCHNLLMHVLETQDVLAEVKRVLKPGGLIACREMMVDSSFTYPDYGVLSRAWDMFEDMVALDDGHPQMGKDLKFQLAEAGFENAWIEAAMDIYSTPEEVAFISQVANYWFLSPEVVEAAILYGAYTEELCSSIAEAFKTWTQDPAAICGIAYGVAVADKP